MATCGLVMKIIQTVLLLIRTVPLIIVTTIPFILKSQHPMHSGIWTILWTMHWKTQCYARLLSMWQYTNDYLAFIVLLTVAGLTLVAFLIVLNLCLWVQSMDLYYTIILSKHTNCFFLNNFILFLSHFIL